MFVLPLTFVLLTTVKKKIVKRHKSRYIFGLYFCAQIKYFGEKIIKIKFTTSIFNFALITSIITIYFRYSEKKSIEFSFENVCYRQKVNCTNFVQGVGLYLQYFVLLIDQPCIFLGKIVFW